MILAVVLFAAFAAFAQEDEGEWTLGGQEADILDDEIEIVETTWKPAEPKRDGWKYVPGTYLIKTLWRNSSPENDKIFTKDGIPAYITCTVRGIAQIINYHKFPAGTTDTIPAYVAKKYNIPVAALPPVVFDWDNMANTYRKVETTESQKKAVATLQDAVARAAKMDYDGGSSGVLAALVEYFDYDYRAKRIYRKDYSLSEWKSILKDQIDQGLPVLYSGVGSKTQPANDEDMRKVLPSNEIVTSHAFIIDGYDENGNFHVNYNLSNGRIGTSNDFRMCENESIGKDGRCWSYNQRAIINLKPGVGAENNLLRGFKKGGKYVLEADIDGKDKMEATLNVKNDFILDLNGHTLTIELTSKLSGADGIKIADGKTFTIMDGKGGGVLNVVTPYLNGAGINAAAGTLIIESGTVYASTSGTSGAGIGGGNGESGGEIVINGGTVTASGGAGIGGGKGGDGGKIIINGGSISASGGANGASGAGIGGGREGGGGDITINGGTITATSGANSAAIGGGNKGAGGNITINGGTIKATGNSYGAGIGGGRDNSGGTITIAAGTVTATSINGAGIGGGRGGNGGKITIKGGTVTATSVEYGAGIGGGRNVEGSGAGGDITISGGKITAVGGTNSAGIGGGGAGGAGANLTISGGSVSATGKGKAKGIGGGAGAVDNGTFKMSGNAFVVTNSVSEAGAKTGGTLVVGSDTTNYGGAKLQFGR